MSKVCICGHFGGKRDFFDGQTIKTKNVYEALKKHFEDIKIVDTYNIKKRIVCVVFQCLKNLLLTENFVFLLAKNGVRLLMPFLVILNNIFRKKLHYVVIGGWLPEFLDKHRKLLTCAKRIDFIYVETNIMKNKLNKLGLSNIVVMNNFKFLAPLDEENLEIKSGEPYMFCTFSRVIKEKGIEDAVNSVRELNERYGRTVATLDIYGFLDEHYFNEFSKLQKSFPSYIQYKGVSNPDDSTEILKKYYMLLFPTYYEGEGFAATLLDAFAAGVPVIATNWRYNEEIVCNGYTGYVYNYKNKNELFDMIEKSCLNPEGVIAMKFNCIDEYKKYLPDESVKVLLKNM